MWLFQESILGFLVVDSHCSYLYRKGLREGLDNEGLAPTVASNWIHANMSV